MYQIKFSYVLILYSHICYLAPEFKVQIDSQAAALFPEVNAIFQCYEKKKKSETFWNSEWMPVSGGKHVVNSGLKKCKCQCLTHLTHAELVFVVLGRAGFYLPPRVTASVMSCPSRWGISSLPLHLCLVSLFPFCAANGQDFQGPSVWGWEGRKQICVRS